MKKETFNAALAGLLHDIGKFAQRAAEGAYIQWNDEAKKEFKYQHALHTDGVVERITPQQWREEIRGAAGRHHRPTTPLERVVALADRLSAGERSDSGDKQPKQLRSIFCSLDGLGLTPPEPQYLPLKKLAIEEDVIFPSVQIDDSHTAYKSLWDDFLAEAKKLKAAHEKNGNRAVYLESLLNLMQQYTWCIPSAYYKSVPDVSLYDHSRMTAALAACLVEQDDALVQAWLKRQNLDKPVALLVGGDISGVQKFIYTITSSGAAKSLRGRSFYLQLLTEAVASYVLQELKLPATNLIYAGGGNFFLLAPVNCLNQLSTVGRDVTERLLQIHRGELYLVLAHSPITAAQFNRTKFHNAWHNLHTELNIAKLKPLADLPKADLTKIIGQGLGEGGDTDRQCNVCGREAAPGEVMRIDDDGKRACALCESFEKLGNDLAKATHLLTLYSKPKLQRNISNWRQGLEAFGVNVWAVNAKKLPPFPRKQYVEFPEDLQAINLSVLKQDAKNATLLEQELKRRDAPRINSFRLFAQLVPTGKDGAPLTFDQLAKDTVGGFKRWGVLRMDVDNLGKLFEKGFIRRRDGRAENSLTLSRLAELSFSLRLFFEGWLPELGQTDPRLANRLYVQYAGGDDLFVVGSWDALPEFALIIRQSFKKYVCQNPNVTLSGGVSLAAEKYPLYQAARDAESAENQAKNFIRVKPRADKGPREKDAFSFLGQAFGWEKFGDIQARAHQLEAWCGDEGPVSRALLQNLLSIYLEYHRGREEAMKEKKWRPDQIYFGPWMWHLAYQLARRREDKRISNKIKEALKELEAEILKNQENIEMIGLAARWAQYLIRK